MHRTYLQGSYFVGLNTSGKGYFILCATTRADLLPTGYYGLRGNIVIEKENAAKFNGLDEVLRFVENHKIDLGESCYIGTLVTNL